LHSVTYRPGGVEDDGVKPALWVVSVGRYARHVAGVDGAGPVYIAVIVGGVWPCV
jgi:hypothetical protein